MKSEKNNIEKERYEKFQRKQPNCTIHKYRIDSVSKYLDVCTTLTSRSGEYWFRGQATYKWDLSPLAFRYEDEKSRTEALKKIEDFKRISPMKLENYPSPDKELEWVQLARHYGVPTRLLDWTKNAAIGLYFACQNEDDEDGLVYLLDPVELNTKTDSDNPRVFDAHEDHDRIKKYFDKTGRIIENGNLRTIAINPVWNSDRILMQKGTFTLHGNRSLSLNEEATSLIALPILEEDKKMLLNQLQLIGIDQMSIFPEPEHVGNYLKKQCDGFLED